MVVVEACEPEAVRAVLRGPDQVAAPRRRRDLPALLDRYVPPGPDQAAVRLGARRVDFEQVVRLGWLSPVDSVPPAPRSPT
ncbi:hypothetical protein ACFWJT_13655 [Streptomyces sp. NPDC127069]|uniref:hypothetical protein n=1 Tax=Streptomyces sp. NPDC127069 TaxID=3347128 RepID=UPI00365F7713